MGHILITAGIDGVEVTWADRLGQRFAFPGSNEPGLTLAQAVRQYDTPDNVLLVEDAYNEGYYGVQPHLGPEGQVSGYSLPLVMRGAEVRALQARPPRLHGWAVDALAVAFRRLQGRDLPRTPPAMNITFHCEECGRILGKDRYTRSPFTGRRCGSRAWCPGCYEKLAARQTAQHLPYWPDLS